MENLLGKIYCWFQSLYGQDLSLFLWGYDPVAGVYKTNLYNVIGLVTIVCTILIVVAYYYILNHPRYCKLWSWFLTMLLNAIFAMFIGYGIVISKFKGGFIPESLLYQTDADGNIVSYLIGQSNCWGFGIANIFVSMIFFVLFSLVCKNWSSSAKYIPF